MEKSVQKVIEEITVRSKKFPEAPRPQTAHCIAPEIGGTNILFSENSGYGPKHSLYVSNKPLPQ